jgi:hypothetical protein
MRRLTILSVAVVAITAVTALTVGSAAAKPRGTNGKIVTNSDNLTTGTEQVYTVDPDGTDEQLVADNSEVGQWSPEGTRITLFGELGELLCNVDDGPSISGCRATSTQTCCSSAVSGRRMAHGLPAKASAKPIRA